MCLVVAYGVLAQWLCGDFTLKRKQKSAFTSILGCFSSVLFGSYVVC